MPEQPGVPSGQEWPPALQELERDDRDAEAYLADQPEVGRKARRILGLLTVAALIGGLIATGVAAVMEQTSAGDRLDPGTHSGFVRVLLGSIAVGLAAYLGYALACLVHIRHAQRVSLAWLRGRDAGQAERGLPPPLLAPFLDVPPGHRLTSLAAWAAGLAALAGLFIGPYVFFGAYADSSQTDTPALVTGIASLAMGVGAGALLIALWVSLSRAHDRQQEFVARYGRRLEPDDPDPDGPDGPDDAEDADGDGSQRRSS